MKKILLALNVFMVVFMTNCSLIENQIDSSAENDTIAIIDKNQILNEIGIRNGILTIPSEEKLFEIVATVNKLNYDEYINWSKKFSGFNSMLILYNNLIELENLESDKILQVFKESNVLPERLNEQHLVHSKEALNHIDLLYIYPEGGIIPVASHILPGLEFLVNDKGQIFIGNELRTYDRKQIKNQKNIDLENKWLGFVDNYSNRVDYIVGSNRTITDIAYYYRTTSAGLVSATGVITVRNFRKGAFGWNTRATTELKIEGDLIYSAYYNPLCYDYEATESILPPLQRLFCSTPNAKYICDRTHSNEFINLNFNSGGSSTSSISLYFTQSTQNNWVQSYNYPYNCSYTGDIQYANFLFIAHKLIITGESNIKTNFDFNWSHSDWQP
ncbi:hypothetical protein [Anditalea andensis]|uniref:FAS1 domain-containing protein n=1 Tax=Anditalea andensis TaxID=1048983 RepID=A0A074KWZ6_9BACT|nr:hypothetical protein [Anditalea andensis]KEO72093.1 hypothetical protein EL17_19475 [Anditalea andensis]